MFPRVSIIVVVTMDVPAVSSIQTVSFDNRHYIVQLYSLTTNSRLRQDLVSGLVLVDNGSCGGADIFLLWTLAFLLWCTHPCRVLSHFMSSSIVLVLTP